MTDRTLYTGVKPGMPTAPTVQKDRLVEQMGGTHGPAASRARIDTVAERLARLGCCCRASPRTGSSCVSGGCRRWSRYRDWQSGGSRQIPSAVGNQRKLDALAPVFHNR